MIVVLATPDMAAGGQRVNVLEPLIGGSGGRPTCDGFDGSDYTFAFLRNTPVEVAEAENPVLVREYGFRRDSGGPGQFRGGMGVVLEFQALLPHTRITARGMERTKFAPWGVHGGRHGLQTAPCTVNAGTDRERIVPKIDILELEPGDVVRIESSGAGGYGDPLTRELERLQHDVTLGFVSREQAEDVYGAIFVGDSLDIDPEATAQQRDERQRNAVQLPYDFGEARLDFEARWPVELHRQLQRLLGTYPVLARGTIKNWVITRALQDHSSGCSSADLARLWAECESVFRRD